MDEPLLPAMLDLQARTGGIVLGLLEVDPEETSRYGIASVEPEPSLSSVVAASPGLGDVLRVTGLVEKPEPDKAPSNLAVRRPVHAAAVDLRRDQADRSPARARRSS